MWINIGETYVNANMVTTVSKYITTEDYGLIVNGVRCPVGISGYRNYIDKYKNERIEEINKELDNVIKSLSYELTEYNK